MYQPPPPQYPPQQPPQKKSRRRLWIILGIISGLLIFSCIGCAVIGATASKSGNSNQVVATQPISIPTSTPIVKLTSTQSLAVKPTTAPTSITNAGPAVLGGTLNAFIAKYGPPNDHSDKGAPHFERCDNSNTDQLILSQISLESSTGPITSVDAAACTSTSWNMTQATAVCSSYFPADAKYQRSIQIPETQTKFASVDKIYYSATLAHKFTADNFTDANGNTVKAGLFDVDYLYVSNSNTSYINGCTIQLGTQQTNG